MRLAAWFVAILTAHEVEEKHALNLTERLARAFRRHVHLTQKNLPGGRPRLLGEMLLVQFVRVTHQLFLPTIYLFAVFSQFFADSVLAFIIPLIACFLFC